MRSKEEARPPGGWWRGGPGFVDPYEGRQACARLHKHGFTFRWCKGDTWVGVLRGTVVDGRRFLIVQDTLVGHQVIEGPVPVIDVIPARGADWNLASSLHRMADAWVGAGHGV